MNIQFTSSKSTDDLIARTLRYYRRYYNLNKYKHWSIRNRNVIAYKHTLQVVFRDYLPLSKSDLIRFDASRTVRLNRPFNTQITNANQIYTTN